jgi:hypothetical protein
MEYLEPGYLAETPGLEFRNAEEMINLLRTYFVTGNEKAEARQAFQNLKMDRGETVPIFKSRFISAAVKGAVPRSEWFFYLWEKILPAIRVPNMGFKHTWNDSFEVMVAHLTAYDVERRSAPTSLERPAPIPQRSTVKPNTDRFRKVTEDAPKPSYVSNAARVTPGVLPRSTSIGPRQPSKTPVPERLSTVGNCYNCGKPGHYANDCPVARVREIEIEPQDSEEEFLDASEHHSEGYRMGNGDAWENAPSQA